MIKFSDLLVDKSLLGLDMEWHDVIWSTLITPRTDVTSFSLIFMTSVTYSLVMSTIGDVTSFFN